MLLSLEEIKLMTQTENGIWKHKARPEFSSAVHKSRMDKIIATILLQSSYFDSNHSIRARMRYIATKL